MTTFLLHCASIFLPDFKISEIWFVCEKLVSLNDTNVWMTQTFEWHKPCNSWTRIIRAPFVSQSDYSLHSVWLEINFEIVWQPDNRTFSPSSLPFHFLHHIFECFQGRHEVIWRPGQEASLAPHVGTWRLSEANILYWKKYLWHCWDFSPPPAVIRCLGNSSSVRPCTCRSCLSNWKTIRFVFRIISLRS